MEHTPTPIGPTAFIAAKVRELRGDMSAAELARRMQAAGIPWTRLIVTKLETHRRQSVSVEELLALAQVLKVAPVHLLAPWDDDAPYRVTPHVTVPAKAAREWVRGWPHCRDGLPGSSARDSHLYRQNVPDSEDVMVTLTEREYDALRGLRRPGDGNE